MDAELKSKWVTALRSGEFKQGNGQLHLEADGYCCLGVLCKVSGIGEWKSKPGCLDYFDFEGEASAMCLPDLFRERVGIGHDEQTILWKMNDLHGRSFAVIADYIEKNL